MTSWQTQYWLASKAVGQPVVWQAGSRSDRPATVPLGSLWKLFVYSYLVEQQAPENPYQCKTGQEAKAGDEYCCIRTEPINRNTALVRSCGAYFDPVRLHINALDWQNYWQKHLPQHRWLHSLDRLQPQSQLTVSELLETVEDLPSNSKNQLYRALAERYASPQWASLIPTLGNAYRFKTFTWQHPQYKGTSFGGALGWLPDQTLYWVGGTGPSVQVVARTARVLSQQIPLNQHLQNGFDDACVTVNYFTRYPIRKIFNSSGAVLSATSTPLRGRYNVEFINGQRLPILAQGDLKLIPVKINPVKNSTNVLTEGQIQIVGKFRLEEYVARVVDREGQPDVLEAAKALAVAARSYLYQNGRWQQGCWHINDSSQQQRVASKPASAAAREAALFTIGMQLENTPIQYHLNQTGPTRLSWQQAVQQAKQGQNFLTILQRAYPQANWAFNGIPQQCEVLADAEHYLQQSRTRLKVTLSQIKGIESVPQVKICKQAYGRPYADPQTLKIYLNDWQSPNGRITLWHEYLHLALRFQPAGQNEQRIEKLARQLATTVTVAKQSPTHPMRKIHPAQ